jgi:hypothetical protein
MINSGASGYAFIDLTFTQSHSLPLQTLRYPRRLDVADGSPISSGSITHLAELRLNIANHHESAPCFVTKLGHYPIILGKAWLRRHNPKVDWDLNIVTFSSDHYRRTCSAPRHFPVQISGITSTGMILIDLIRSSYRDRMIVSDRWDSLIGSHLIEGVD